MRRALALSWALGTSTGVLLGLFGVQLVTSGITGARIAPLSHPEVLQALSAGSAKEASEAAAAAAAASTPDTGSAPPLPDPVSQPAPKPPASAPPRPGATAGTTTTTRPAPPVTAPPVTAPPVTSPPPPTTTTTAPRGETRSISSQGGAVTVRYLDGQVRLLFARPNSGYDVEVVDDGPDQVYVEFRGPRGSRSRVVAFYDKNGQPDSTVVEKGGGKDDGGVNSTGSRVSQESDGADLDLWSEDRERNRR